jgi:hypothetical protein
MCLLSRDEKRRWTRWFAPLVALVAVCGVAGCDGGEPDWLDPSLGCANLPQLVGRWTGGFESEVFDDGGGNLLLVVTDTDEARCEAVGTVTVTLDLAPGQPATSATTFRLAGDRVEYGVVGGVVDGTFRGTLSGDDLEGEYSDGVAHVPGLTSAKDRGTWVLARSQTGPPAPPPPSRNDTIPVVFLVDRSPGPDGNCATTDPEAWLDEPDGAPERCFLVGGVHLDTPICSDERSDHCLTPDERLAAGATLNDWVPNQLEMFDDGTHGDERAGDGRWTLVLELPYWPPAAAPDGAGVRIGYKYTWGRQGDLWTGTEEWPGNQRLLELADQNGDGLVVRVDRFGDQATNKDRGNLRAESNGGCGTVVWEAVQAAEPAFAGCVMDTRENRIDSDGDCVLDTWPTFELEP